ncbi:D(2)-like dopamine receptor [Palaemon carinicauda]|uniref:D(2)-like dopamine receptor n=1 Tax=Palaemon carinicauda TaxID=392227 RepID=UPI0035B5C9F2
MPGPWEGDLTTSVSLEVPRGEVSRREFAESDDDSRGEVILAEVYKELIRQGGVLSIVDYPANTTSLWIADNQTAWAESGEQDAGSVANWWGLVALLVVLLTLFGNILLILAISWDRRLQNMTNYFLLSLAVTDLMVASLVMPLSIVVLVLGHFPFSSRLCLVWISLDVLFCTASIMHLCTLSVDRFLSLRYPMKFGRNKTRRRVVLKIILVWCLSFAASLPLSLMYATDPHSTIVDGVCQIPVSLFQIIGSIICFYIPLIIMLVTYALTVRLLSKKQSELQASVLEPSSATPSPRSVRWKKFLCKTSSNLSTSTAVSVTDGDTCDTGCGSLESRCDDCKLRRFGSSPLRRPPLVRYTSHHYRAALARGGACGRRGYSVREHKRDVSDTSGEDRLYPPLPGNPSFELSVFPHSSPDRSRSAPTSATTSPRHRRNKSDGSPSRHSHPDPSLTRMEKEENNQETKSITNASCEQNGGPRRKEAQNDCNDECEGTDNSEHVTVPCSCAPRFFLEDIKASPDSQCQDCTDPRPHEVTSPFQNRHHRPSQDLSPRRRDSCCTGCCPKKGRRTVCCCPCSITRLISRHNGSKGNTSGLSSPWNEESSTRSSDLVTRATLRPSGQVTTMLHKPPSVESSSVTSSPGSSRGLWRQQSCTASIKYVSSKKHGRNIRMEQKATKVLGVVFFTFVLLWAPFFITNVLISFGTDIGEDMINFVTWLGYASSMVNPFFYTFFNKTFRQTFLKIIKCEMRRGKKYHF